MVTRTLVCALVLVFSSFVLSPLVSAGDTPKIAFSDITNGPSSGLGDNLGEGAIVTLWGYNFGDAKGNVFVTDSANQKRAAAHIYYWKRADGKLPSGPADLFSSHALYEIAFSLPESASGEARITVTTASDATSEAMGFNIRSGRIFHAKPSGSNSQGDGSFTNPWQFVNGFDSSLKAPGNAGLKAGDILYTHGVTEPVQGDSFRSAGMYLRRLEGDLERQIGIISYPGTHSKVESPRWGVHPYITKGVVISKYIALGGLLDDPKDDSPTFGAGPISDSTMQIQTSKDGRVVGNYISDSPGKCSNGLSGAISSTDEHGSNAKIFGNFIHEIGCNQTSHFQHTTYMTKRSAKGQAASEAWEFAWNRLEDNKAVFGIHFYDQSPYGGPECDPVIGVFEVHHNYVKNQRGSAVNILTSSHDGVSACWTVDSNIFNNIFVNVGLGPIAEANNGTHPYAITVGGDLDGDFYIYNNLIYGVSDASSRDHEVPHVFNFRNKFKDKEVVVANNAIKSNYPMDMIRNQYGVLVKYISNIWFIDELNANAESKFFEGIDNPVVADLGIIFLGDRVSLDDGSPLHGNASDLYKPDFDYYGGSFRDAEFNIGPLGADNDSVRSPSPPENIRVQ